MRVFILVLSSLLVAGTVAAAFADFEHVPVDSPLGLRLGRFYLLDDSFAVESARLRMGKTGFAGAEQVFDAALQRDPGSAYRWCDKGELLLRDGNRSEAEQCYIRAGQLAPHDIRILLNLGDYYTAIGEPTKALKNFSAILGQTDVQKGEFMVGNIFGYYTTLKVVQNHLLDQAIPDATNALAYFLYVEKTGDARALREVWDWACGKGFDDDRMAVEYTRFMFNKQQYEAAHEGWVTHFGKRNDGYPQASLIFNGGFEYEATGGVFDWEFGTTDTIKGVRDSQIRQAGRYSYRIDFSVNENINLRNFNEIVYARPGKYHFEGWMRTLNITSDEGIRFRLRPNRDSNAPAVETPALTGTNEWTPLEADIEVPAGSVLTQIEIARRPSLRIDNQLNGTVWIDSLKLTPR